MATAKKATDDAVQQLTADVEALKGDIGNLVNSLKAAGLEQGTAALKTAEAKGAQVKAQAAEMGELTEAAARQAAEKAQNVVREQPMTAVLVAAAAGLAVGFLTSKK